jgi:hypothetical protein
MDADDVVDASELYGVQASIRGCRSSGIGVGKQSSDAVFKPTLFPIADEEDDDGEEDDDDDGA